MACCCDGGVCPLHAHQRPSGLSFRDDGRLVLRLDSKAQAALVGKEFSYLHPSLASHCDALVFSDVYAPPIGPDRIRHRLGILLEFILRP